MQFNILLKKTLFSKLNMYVVAETLSLLGRSLANKREFKPSLWHSHAL